MDMHVETSTSTSPQVRNWTRVDTSPFWTNDVARFWFIRPKTTNLLTMAWEGRDNIKKAWEG